MIKFGQVHFGVFSTSRFAPVIVTCEVMMERDKHTDRGKTSCFDTKCSFFVTERHTSIIYVCITMIIMITTMTIFSRPSQLPPGLPVSLHSPTSESGDRAFTWLLLALALVAILFLFWLQVVGDLAKILFVVYNDDDDGIHVH